MKNKTTKYESFHFYDEVEDPYNRKYYDVQDIIDAEYNLEPLKCRYCGSEHDVIFLQYIGDAYCEICGKWQLNPDAD